MISASKATAYSIVFQLYMFLYFCVCSSLESEGQENCCYLLFLLLSLVLKLLILLFAEDEHGADSKGHQRRCLFFPADIFVYQ